VAHSGLPINLIYLLLSVEELPKRGIFRTSGEENLYLLLSTKEEPKSLPPDTIYGLKMYPKSFSGRWEAHNVPQIPLLDLGATWQQGREGKDRRREGKGK